MSYSYGQGEDKKFANGFSEQQLRNQVIGWYEAERNRRLTILPQKKKLVAVFDWGNGAPTSVGEISVNDEGKLVFTQSVGMEVLELEADNGAVRSLSIMNIRFTKDAGLTTATGQYANKKNQVMDVSCRDGELYCSIAWGNNAPQTNGWFRAAPNGKTVLQGFKWQEDVSLRFKNGLLNSITIVGQDFVRTKEQPASREAKPADEPDR